MSADWRTIGDTTLAVYRREFQRVNSPMLAEVEAVYELARPHSALLLAMMWHEQKYATLTTIPASHHNPLSLKGAPQADGSRAWMAFTTWAGGVFAAKDRITSATYGNGSYFRTTTLDDLLEVFAPAIENDAIRYRTVIEERIAAYKAIEETSMPALNMTKGLIPLPNMEESIVNVALRDQSINCRGYDRLGTRTVKACVLHRAQSNGSNAGYFHLRCCPALTDIEVHHQTGHMKRFVRIPGNSPSGWANGAVSAPYGDGKAFVDRYGTDAVNRDVESCEVCGHFAQPGEPSSWEEPVADVVWPKLAQWIASRAHDYGVSWETFPLIPAEGNRSFVIWHQEFTIGTGKVCPGKTVMDATPALIDRAKQIMKSAQTGGITVPGPTPTPDATYPPGLDASLAETLFGKVIKNKVPYAFDEDGPVSKLWLAEGAKTGVYPKLVGVDTFDTRIYFRFANGLVIWTPNKAEPVRILKAA